MPYQRRTTRRSIILGQRRLAGLLFAILIILAVLLYGAQRLFLNEQTQPQETMPPQTPTSDQQTIEPIEEPVLDEVPAYDTEALQSVLDAWEQSVRGNASVVVATAEGKVLASVNPDDEYFTASIYKLYVAYEGYRQVDSGAVNADEAYLNDVTRGYCLDIMIRESDSPCAEKLWVELGKDTTTDTLEGYGLTHTNMAGLNTSAYDAARMLARIARGEGLSADSQRLLLASMREQIFDDTLNVSFADDIVYNKIGFNEQLEYHDVAIVEFADESKVIISVLTSGVGTAAIVSLGNELRPLLAPM